MTKFEVSDAMVEAASNAYEQDNSAGKMVRERPMRAAISAAFEASGLVEEVAEAKAEITRMRQA